MRGPYSSEIAWPSINYSILSIDILDCKFHDYSIFGAADNHIDSVSAVCMKFCIYLPSTSPGHIVNKSKYAYALNPSQVPYLFILSDVYDT